MIRRNHAQIFIDRRVRKCLGVAGLLLFLTLTAFPVAAQTPTPWPWPTPIVTDDYVVHQEITYGEGGIILAGLFVAGLLLLDIFLSVMERLTSR